MPTVTPEGAIGLKLQPILDDLLRELTPDTTGRPLEIFHYTDGDGLLGIVKSNRLWASDVLFMNDATEVEYGRSLIVSEARRAITEGSPPLVRQLFDSMDNILYPMKAMAGAFFAACFCQDPDLLSQWRGYAGGTGGYSLGFKVEELGAREGNRAPWQEFVLRRVIYERDDQRALVGVFLQDVAEAIEELTTGPLADYQESIRRSAEGMMQYALLACMLTLKNPVFKEEKEWRLVHQRIRFGVTAQIPVEYRAARSFLVPYVSLDISPGQGQRANKIPLSRVIVGPTAHPDAAAASVRALLQHAIPTAEVENSKVPIRA